MSLRTLYISDLDGTLLNPEKEISTYARQTINSFLSRGGHFTVATARSSSSAVNILSGLNIDVPVVLMNGAVLFDFRGQKYIKTENIPLEQVNHVIDIIKEYRIPGFMYAVVNGDLVTYYEYLETKPMKDFHDERVQKYNKTFVKVTGFEDRVQEGNVIYFSLIDDYDKLRMLHDVLKGYPSIDMAFYRDNYGDRPWYLEIHSVTASKYNAVRYLRELCGFDKVIGFGDNYNDIPLLKACDEFYSVANAVEELKVLSTATIGSNIEDAVPGFLLGCKT